MWYLAILRSWYAYSLRYIADRGIRDERRLTALDESLWKVDLAILCFSHTLQCFGRSLPLRPLLAPHGMCT